MKPTTHDAKDWIRLAEKNGLEITRAKGSHVKITAPAGRGYMIVPMNRELHKGINNAIAKWFKALGILISIIALAVLFLHIL